MIWGKAIPPVLFLVLISSSRLLGNPRGGQVETLAEALRVRLLVGQAAAEIEQQLRAGHVHVVEHQAVARPVRNGAAR